MFSGGAPYNPYKKPLPLSEDEEEKVDQDVDSNLRFTDPTGGDGQEVRAIETPDNGGVPS